MNGQCTDYINASDPVNSMGKISKGTYPPTADLAASKDDLNKAEKLDKSVEKHK